MSIEAYVGANPGQPIAVSSLSRLVGLSERGLRNAFRVMRGTSPKRWIVATRLESVHRALRTAGARSTVTSVATGHGFYELGRFAALYKRAYGESPSATLRGGRRTEEAARS